MPISKAKMRERKRLERAVVNPKSILSSGVTWETMPITDIKEVLPDNIVEDIINLGEYDCIRKRPITLEERFRLAYKYQVWHDDNFIDGIHEDSKY